MVVPPSLPKCRNVKDVLKKAPVLNSSFRALFGKKLKILRASRRMHSEIEDGLAKRVIKRFS